MKGEFWMERNIKDLEKLRIIKDFLDNNMFNIDFMEYLLNSFNIEKDAPCNMFGKLIFLKNILSKINNGEQLLIHEEELFKRCLNDYYLYEFFVNDKKVSEETGRITPSYENEVAVINSKNVNYFMHGIKYLSEMKNEVSSKPLSL